MHYKGTKCTYDSIDFDSIPEKEYYIKLVNDNNISELQVHPKFIILEGFRNYESKKIQSITFKPDFYYIRDGIVHIEDVKPLNKKLIDESFTLRWKMLKNMYKEQKAVFRLIAWDKKLKEFVEI